MTVYYRDSNGTRWFPYEDSGGQMYVHPERAENDMGDLPFEDAEVLVGMLSEIGYIRERLSEFYEAEGVGIWLTSPNRWLNGEAPADVVRAGREGEVHAIIDRLVSGAFS